MYHSILIGTNILVSSGVGRTYYKNTWTDWHLIPATRPLVAPPSPKLSLVEIPGADGTLDLTESLTGRALFNDRSGSWEFYVENGYKDWATLYSEIMLYLHGKRLQVVFEDDPSYWYEGRLSVNQWRSDPYHSKIVIDYVLGPYKRYSLANEDNWLWDTFNFETDTIRSYRNMVVKKNQPLEFSITGGMTETVPTIQCTKKGVKLEITNIGNDGQSSHYYGPYTLVSGVNVDNEILIRPGTNNLRFTTATTGTTYVTIKVEGGLL